ncbi:MAG: thymidine phosphorylase [Bacillota bacterium]
MNMYTVLDAKRKGLALTDQQIEYVIQGAVTGDIPDYQLSALLMAICIQGAGQSETLALARAMTESGHSVDFSGVPGVIADKHSSGGVGDSTTLVVAPVCAACGLKVAKMSGRALGHTGGTIDKLESIPGLSVTLSPQRFREVLSACGLAITQQSDGIAPADKRLYALRDATATVESIPLIASSIMSKKMALKTHVLVLDVKCGAGAFMKTLQDARLLARVMVDIGRCNGRAVRAVVTAMDQPLGDAVGNALEVREAVEVLGGARADTPFAQVCVELCAHMLELGGVCDSLEKGREKARHALADGSALHRFRMMVELQGGDSRFITPEGVSRLLTARTRTGVFADKAGVVQNVDARKVGTAARMLGAGRWSKTDRIDPAAGVVCRVREGNTVEPEQELFEVHANDDTRLDEALKLLKEACSIGDEERTARPFILETVV